MYIIGGHKYGKASNQVWVFHSIEREYIKLPFLEFGRYSHSLHSKEDMAYIIGGYTTKMKVI